MSEASGGATAMDTLERKFAIPEKSGDAGEADSPEQSGVQTPKHEYQSGFKRLRPTGWEEVEGSEHGTGSGEDDELPGTSVGSIEATADEVRYLQNRTKSACSQLADIIVELRRERGWSADKDTKTARKRELLQLLRSIQRRLDKLESNPELDTLRSYIAFALEKASCQQVGLCDLLDDELQLILSHVAEANGSPKQLLALSAVSTRFRKLVRQPGVWQTLDMSAHASFLTDRLLLSIVRDDGAFANVQRVCLAGCNRLTDSAVCRLLDVCGENLECLELSDCTLISTSTIEHAARVCRSRKDGKSCLVFLDLAGCSNVDTLDALRLTETNFEALREIRLMGTSRLNGRVPQDEFVELARELEARRARWRDRIGRRREDAVRRAEADDSPADVGNTMTAEDMMNMIDPSGSCIDCACGDAARGEEIEPWILEGRENVPAWVTTCCIQPALCVVDLPRRVKHWKTKLDIWEEGTAPIAACDHAMVMQGNMNDPGHQHQLNLLPGCGHVLCVDCEQRSRVHMVRRHLDNEYVYPCPLCGMDMPNPGGFEITLNP